MDSDDALSMHNEYSTLNLADLLLARERNHVELMRRANVIGTAVGLYLMRKDDSRDRKADPPPRTLGNSEVRSVSWPSILVFVDTWMAEHELHWQDRIPPNVYLDDKRKVPVCVVYAPKQDAPEVGIRPVVYPTARIGGGFPLMVDVQGREHVASIGCLVRDGHTVYALTNRHVTGATGEPVYARVGDERIRIGVASNKQLSRLPFVKMYPEWAGKETYLNLDVGLVRIDDLNRWTAAVYGIGMMGPLADLGIDNLSLRLIDCPVRGYGCGSGHMRGAIKALFYRYKSMGGFEYVSDFLIGARNAGEDLSTHPGDSGTLWLLESKEQGLMPLAVQWGGQVFSSGNGRQQSSYALATCLSTVCNLLDVDVVRDWNVGVSEYWGEVGHFAIGALACTVGFTGAPGLEKLMSKNIEQVGFAVKDLRVSDRIRRNVTHFAYVPLADVADDVWRNTRASKGETGNDENNHFADMDQKGLKGKYKGKTLLQLCEDPKNVDPAVWLEFYQGVAGTNPGALPFRVWQGYNLMVKALKDGDVLTFLCVAGCLAHYVGDACQPLHISRLHHGHPENATSTSRKVHSVYETDMLNAHADKIVDGIVAALKDKVVSPSFSGGKGAALRVVRLMKDTVKALPPGDIVDAYNAEKGAAARLDRLWNAFGQKTIARMTDGILCLADIWASAWKEGNGEQTIPKSDLVVQDQKELSDLYSQADFYKSVSLALMVPMLKGSVSVTDDPHSVSPPRVGVRPTRRAGSGRRKRTLAKVSRRKA